MDEDASKIRQKLLNNNIDSEVYRNDFFPFDLTWFVSLKCQLSCKYCFLPPSIRKHRFLAVAATDVLRRCQDNGVFKINVLGGEPFLEPKILIELAKNCDKFKVVYRSTSTNGLIFDKDVVRAWQGMKYKHILQISLDAATSRTHSRMRHHTHFDKIINNTKRFVTEGLSVMLGMTLTQHNINEIAMFAKLGESLGVEMLSFGGMMPLGGGVNVSDWHLSYHQMNQAFRRIKALPTRLPIVLPNDIYGRTCGAGLGQASMLPNGDLFPCNMLLGFPEARLGNLFDPALDKFSNSWFIKLSAYKVPARCDKCQLPPICDSACKAISYQVYGDFREHQSLCLLNGKGQHASL